MTDYVEMAKDALTRPSDFGWHGDDNMFVTWGITGPHYAINGDDTLNESNFESFKVMAHDKFCTEDYYYGPNFDVVGIKHWAVGSLDSVITKVLMDETPDGRILVDGIRHKDIEEEYLTPEFIWLCDILEGLKDYPVLNDEDYSERQMEYAYQIFIEGLPSEIDAGKVSDVISNLSDQGLYVDEEDRISEDDIYTAAYEVGGDDKENYKEEWEAWEFFNPSAVTRRYLKLWEETQTLLEGIK